MEVISQNSIYPWKCAHTSCIIRTRKKTYHSFVISSWAQLPCATLPVQNFIKKIYKREKTLVSVLHFFTIHQKIFAWFAISISQCSWSLLSNLWLLSRQLEQYSAWQRLLSWEWSIIARAWIASTFGTLERTSEYLAFAIKLMMVRNS